MTKIFSEQEENFVQTYIRDKKQKTADKGSQIFKKKLVTQDPIVVAFIQVLRSANPAAFPCTL